MKFLFLALLLLTTQAFAGKATITKVIGVVTSEGKELAKGSVIEEGHEITVVGPKSLVQINFDDHSRALLKAGTYKIEKAQGKEDNVLLVVTGILFSHKAKGKSNLEIRTANAVMGVRGTKFYVEASPDETYLCVCEGAVGIGNSKENTIVKKGFDSRVKKGSGVKATPANQNMLDMASAGFKDME